MFLSSRISMSVFTYLPTSPCVAEGKRALSV